MDILRQQAGAQFFEETVRIFLNLFASSNIINEMINDDADSSCVVVEKYVDKSIVSSV